MFGCPSRNMFCSPGIIGVFSFHYLSFSCHGDSSDIRGKLGTVGRDTGIQAGQATAQEVPATAGVLTTPELGSSDSWDDSSSSQVHRAWTPSDSSCIPSSSSGTSSPLSAPGLLSLAQSARPCAHVGLTHVCWGGGGLLIYKQFGQNNACKIHGIMKGLVTYL